MKKLTLTNYRQTDAVVIGHEFIDRYMPEANGEFVKIYLLLMRCLNDPSKELTVSGIADLLDDTEKDVIRALKYWKKQGLLDFQILDPQPGSPSGGSPEDASKDPEQPSGRKSAEALCGAAKEKGASPDGSCVSPSPEPSKENITQFRNRKELKELLFVAEQYLGKTLSATDMKTITYFYDALGMSTDLIEYLIEYCVENGHKSIHYIQKVALSWSDQGFTTVEAAKANAAAYSKSCFSVLKAFGITGRTPAPSEVVYIRRWSGEYGFSLELILEACRRTMNSIHQPSFDYTESILKNWKEKDVHTLKDVESLDAAYLKTKSARRKASASQETPRTSKNKFNNFEGRPYEDMDDLTRRLIQ